MVSKTKSDDGKVQFLQTYTELDVSCGLLLQAQPHPTTMGLRLVFQGQDLACYTQ